MTKSEVIILFVVSLKIISIITFSETPDPAMFQQNNHEILDILDDLFILLQINKNFSRIKHVEEYMSRHSLIQDALCNNRKKYKEIHDISKPKISHKTAYYISNINDVIDEMISNEIVRKPRDIRNNNSITAEADSKDFVNLARRFKLNIKTLALTASKLPSTKGLSQDKGRRIFEGSSAGIERYPFMVSVHVAGRFVCAGSLLHESLALSAASCLMRSADVDGQVQIRVASDFVSEMGYLINIEELFHHPQFDRTTLANNLVLLRTKKALRFKKQRIVAIQYDRATTSTLKANTEDIVILGWGRRKTDGADLREEERPLSEAHIELYDFAACQYIYTRDFVTDKTFCAGFVNRGAGACNHDAGGPALVGDVLVGVISFGSPHCGAADAPTVFTHLGIYDHWIDSVIQNLGPNKLPSQQEKISKNVLREDIINIDEELKDVYRENFIVDDVLYGPIETTDDNEITNISSKSFLKQYINDLSNFPNTNMITKMKVPQPEPSKAIKIPEGYWRDYSSEEKDISTENQLDTDMVATYDTNQADNENRFQVLDSQNFDPDHVKSTIEFTSITEGNTFITNPRENCAKFDSLCKERINNILKNSDLRETPVNSNGFNNVGSQQMESARLTQYPFGNERKEESKVQVEAIQLKKADIDRTARNERAVVILLDSGTTQRIQVHQKDPIYKKGFKVLAAKILQGQALV